MLGLAITQVQGYVVQGSFLSCPISLLISLC